MDVRVAVVAVAVDAVLSLSVAVAVLVDAVVLVGALIRAAVVAATPAVCSPWARVTGGGRVVAAPVWTSEQQQSDREAGKGLRSQPHVLLPCVRGLASL